MSAFCKNRIRNELHNWLDRDDLYNWYAVTKKLTKGLTGATKLYLFLKVIRMNSIATFN